ncbi:hypothetical protein B9Z55_011014 [Caenorhabditis nigoni]|uniref:Uncharacterized protein n=1 Tax=Caenorhabditis nigoni TaxID=1611254 RepID=A0A2G5UIJ1_9PELO|nr:hypothetical protein B9Z55_011014 [Caenorhabditis nigoni]
MIFPVYSIRRHLYQKFQLPRNHEWYKRCFSNVFTHLLPDHKPHSSPDRHSLDHKYCSSNFEMLGSHISMYVDWRYQVRKTTKIIQDGWETRIKNGETKAEICFQYNETEGDGETMILEHEIYGTIVIKRSMLPDYYRNNTENSWYIGWVRYAPNYKSEVWFAMSSVREMHGPFDYQPAATIVTKSVDEALHEVAEMKKA